MGFSLLWASPQHCRLPKSKEAFIKQISTFSSVQVGSATCDVASAHCAPRLRSRIECKVAEPPELNARLPAATLLSVCLHLLAQLRLGISQTDSHRQGMLCSGPADPALGCLVACLSCVQVWSGVLCAYPSFSDRNATCAGVAGSDVFWSPAKGRPVQGRSSQLMYMLRSARTV